MRYLQALIVAASIIFFVLLTTGCGKSESKIAAGNAGAKPATAVNGFVARSQNITNTVNASGTLLANEEVEIRPELQLRVTNLYFNEGATVTKGQLLVKLDDADILAQLKKVQAQQTLTEKNVDRLAELIKINGVSVQEYDAARTLQKSYDADIEALKNQLRKTEIRAPFSGQIGLRNVSEGAYVTPQTLIATLQQLNPLKIDFAIPEKYAVLVKNNDRLRFIVDGFKDTFAANVYAIEPKVDVATRNIKVRARTQNPGGKLLPGMFANVSLGIDGRKDAVMIPTQAIIPVARGKQAIVVKGGKATYVPVETGLRDADLVEITTGIQAGDTVVITGLMQLKPNGEVRISKIVK